MGFINELYYGNINPNENCLNHSKQYAMLLKDFCDSEKKLEEMLSGEELKIFHRLINTSDEINAINSLENFKTGFRLGVQMLCDSLIFEDSKVLRDIE